MADKESPNADRSVEFRTLVDSENAKPDSFSATIQVWRDADSSNPQLIGQTSILVGWLGKHSGK